jgi:cellulose synthase (UDP-forming)
MERRRGLVPSRRGRAVDGFWWCHPHLTQTAAAGALVWGLGYLVWRVGWSGSGIPGWLFWPLVGAEWFGWTSLVTYAWLAWRVPTIARPPTAHDAVRHVVDVFVCTYDEPADVVEPTLIGCAAIRGPHTTFLLDDGRQGEMRALAQRYGAVYITRADNAHAKAGNINHALGRTSGDLILVLDADHVPLPGILEETLPYFDVLSVALVQTPHDFSNRDSAQHHGPQRHEQSLFYDVIAPNKDRQNAMFWCGSATVIRRAALEDVGGVLTATIAEDFHTTLAMHTRGWRTRYHAETLVQALAPHDLGGFLLQRARWARGNLGVFRTRQNPMWCRGLTLRQRLSYLGSLLHYFSGVQRVTLLAVLTTTLVSGQLPMHANMLVLAALWMPWAVLAFVATLALGRGTLATLDSTRYGLMTMGVQVKAVISLLYPRAGRFKVTPKDGIDEGGLGVVRLLPLVTLGLIAVVAAAMARVLALTGTIGLPQLPGLASTILLALAAWETFCLLAVLVPLVRRHQLRRRYRLPVTGRARLNGRSTTIGVVDISARGIGLESPIALDSGTCLRLLARLPDVDGRVHDVTLPVVVQSCEPLDVTDAQPRFRVGAEFDGLLGKDRRRVLEYCAVVHPDRALSDGIDPEGPAEQVRTVQTASKPARALEVDVQSVHARS